MTRFVNIFAAVLAALVACDGNVGQPSDTAVSDTRINHTDSGEEDVPEGMTLLRISINPAVDATLTVTAFSNGEVVTDKDGRPIEDLPISISEEILIPRGECDAWWINIHSEGYSEWETYETNTGCVPVVEIIAELEPNPCLPYEWLVVDDEGNPVKWECPAWVDGDIGLTLEERDGVCFFVSPIIGESPVNGGIFDLYPPDRFIGHSSAGNAECFPMK